MTTPDPHRPGQHFPLPNSPGQGPYAYPQQGQQPGQYFPQPGGPVPGMPQPPGGPFPQQGAQPYYPQPGQPQYPQPVSGNYPQPNQPFPQPGYPQYNQQPSQQFPPAGYPQQNYPQPAYPQPGQPQAHQQPFPGYGSQPSPFPQSVPVSPAGQQPMFPQSANSPIPISAQQPVAAAPAARVAMPAPVAPKPAAAPAAVPRPAPAKTPTTPTAAGNRPLPLGSRPVPVSAGAKATTTIRRPGDGNEDDEDEKPLDSVAVRKAPPWLVSLIVHLVLIIILAVIVFTRPPSKVIEILSEPIYAEDLGEQLQEDVLETAVSMELEIPDPTLAIDSNPVEDPFAAPPEIEMVDLLDATKATSDIAAPSIGLALSGREKGAKSALLAAYGGTATTEAAVREGLLWLKKQQKADGTWSLVGPYQNGAGVENVASATSMALLAFQGHGDTHKTGEFKDVVAKGWEAMLKMQDADGNFVRESALHQHLYAQAQATIAVCEIYGMTKDEKFKGPAQKALDYAHNAQAPEGGWRYEPKIDSDTSVTGWFVMALQSGLMAGLEVQSPAFDKINEFLDRCQSEGGARYGYQPGREETLTMTAEGLLCRMYLGWKHDDERLKRGVDYVLFNPINYGDENVYYWYYATQALHHMEGPEWDKWNAVMRQQVPSHQIKTGPEQGSWSPTDDRWGTRAGRLYTTCLSIYMLEVYYRHLPLYAQQYRPLTKN